jgi:hypothetical protein
MGKRKSAHKILAGDLRERAHLEDPGVDSRIILNWIFKQWDWAGHGLDLSCSG